MAENKNIDNENEELDQVTLFLEDGSEMLCDVIAYFPFDGKNYVALLPVDDPDSDFLIYGFVEKGEEIELVDIEDDDEFDAVSEEFSQILDEQEFADFLEDDEE